jgi:hypothetical protein
MINAIFQNSDLIIAGCAIIISFFSLIVAARTLCAQRIHNYLSVRPIAQFSYSDYENCIFVKLYNYGTGPLLVEKFSVQTQSDQNIHSSVINAFGGLENKIIWNDFAKEIDGRALSPNAELTLIEVSFSPTQNETRSKVRSALAKMTLHLSYKDIYDRPQSEKKESLSWFSRHQEQK